VKEDKELYNTLSDFKDNAYSFECKPIGIQGNRNLLSGLNISK
jgi:hypothetical protein